MVYDPYVDDLEGEMLGEDEMLGYGRPTMRPMPMRMLRRPMRLPPGRAFIRPQPGPGLPQMHPLATPFPGSAGPAGMQSNLGFGTEVFTNTSVLLFVFTARPQRLVRPKQLVVILTRTATALEAITVASLFVGPINQFSNAAALPAEMFSADGTTGLMGTSAAPGTDIVLTIICAVNPAPGQTITVNAALNVDAIG